MDVLIALGANSSTTLAANARRIERVLPLLPGQVRSVSQLYRTPAWPPSQDHDFVNAVIVLRTNMAPLRLLQALHGLEARFGRVRARRWGPRSLDLDVLAVMGPCVLPDRVTLRKWMTLDPSAQTTLAPDRLILPHPRLQDRPFVLIPMQDVAPDWCHPVTGRTVRSMVASLSTQDRLEIRPIGPVRGVVNAGNRS